MRSLIFIDDERDLDDVKWIKYPNYNEVFVYRRMCDFMFAVMHIEDLENYDFSFDHDIQDFSSGDIENTGYDCMKWLCNYIMESEIKFDPDVTQIYVHSQNPIGRENILNYWRNFCEYYLEVLNDF